VRKIKFKSVHLRLDVELYEKLKNIANKTNKSQAETFRQLLRKGLAMEYVNENDDSIAKLIRHQVDVAMKVHVERLAALSAKGGHMAATAAFLNVQALQDLVPAENKKDVRTMYDKARVKAAEYLRVNTKEYIEKDF